MSVAWQDLTAIGDSTFVRASTEQLSAQAHGRED